MTIQNWALCPGSAIIVCDTIVTDMHSNRPISFTTKAFVVPHRSLMLASLAWTYPVMSLYSNLALGAGPEDPDDLPAYATSVLRAAAAQQEPLAWHADAEVVMFGWDEPTNTIHGRRFFPRDDYQSEEMEPGSVLLRPMPRANVAGLDCHQVGLQQQTEDREIAAFDRDNIGGTLMAYEMRIDPEGRPPQITITNYGPMPHYEEQSSAIRSWMDEKAIPSFELA